MGCWDFKLILDSSAVHEQFDANDDIMITICFIGIESLFVFFLKYFMIISMPLQFIILFINKLTFSFPVVIFFQECIEYIYYGPKCSYLKVKRQMTIELIDSASAAAVASIKVRLKCIHGVGTNLTFPRGMYNHLFRIFEREKKVWAYRH